MSDTTNTNKTNTAVALPVLHELKKPTSLNVTKWNEAENGGIGKLIRHVLFVIFAFPVVIHRAIQFAKQMKQYTVEKLAIEKEYSKTVITTVVSSRMKTRTAAANAAATKLEAAEKEKAAAAKLEEAVAATARAQATITPAPATITTATVVVPVTVKLKLRDEAGETAAVQVMVTAIDDADKKAAELKILEDSNQQLDADFQTAKTEFQKRMDSKKLKAMICKRKATIAAVKKAEAAVVIEVVVPEVKEEPLTTPRFANAQRFDVPETPLATAAAYAKAQAAKNGMQKFKRAIVALRKAKADSKAEHKQIMREVFVEMERKRLERQNLTAVREHCPVSFSAVAKKGHEASERGSANIEAYEREMAAEAAATLDAYRASVAFENLVEASLPNVELADYEMNMASFSPEGRLPSSNNSQQMVPFGVVADHEDTQLAKLGERGLSIGEDSDSDDTVYSDGGDVEIVEVTEERTAALEAGRVMYGPSEEEKQRSESAYSGLRYTGFYPSHKETMAVLDEMTKEKITEVILRQDTLIGLLESGLGGEQNDLKLAILAAHKDEVVESGSAESLRRQRLLRHEYVSALKAKYADKKAAEAHVESTFAELGTLLGNFDLDAHLEQEKYATVAELSEAELKRRDNLRNKVRTQLEELGKDQPVSTQSSFVSDAEVELEEAHALSTEVVGNVLLKGAKLAALGVVAYVSRLGGNQVGSMLQKPDLGFSNHTSLRGDAPDFCSSTGSEAHYHSVVSGLSRMRDQAAMSYLHAYHATPSMDDLTGAVAAKYNDARDGIYARHQAFVNDPNNQLIAGDIVAVGSGLAGAVSDVASSSKRGVTFVASTLRNGTAQAMTKAGEFGYIAGSAIVGKVVSDGQAIFNAGYTVLESVATVKSFGDDGVDFQVLGKAPNVDGVVQDAKAFGSAAYITGQAFISHLGNVSFANGEQTFSTDYGRAWDVVESESVELVADQPKQKELTKAQRKAAVYKGPAELRAAKRAARQAARKVSKADDVQLVVEDGTLGDEIVQSVLDGELHYEDVNKKDLTKSELSTVRNFAIKQKAAEIAARQAAV